MSEAGQSAEVSGSGAAASHGGVAAGAGGVAVGRDIIDSIVITGHGNQVTVTIQGENVRDMELAYLDGLLKRYEYWRDRYTPLAGITEVRAVVKDGPRLDLPMPFIPPGFEKLVEHGYGERVEVRRVPVDDLRAAVAEHRQVILLGEPGSGKTTTLWRLAYDYAVAARDDGRAALPVLVPLGGYTDPGPFDVYLARYLGPLALHLETYRASGRLVLLLDGLNEMPQVGYAERVGRIRQVLDRQPDETVVVTCRALDYVVKLERLQKLEISPLDQTRVQVFLHNYLGETAGERLFWAMSGGDEVRALWETWQRAGGRWTEFWTAEKMPEKVYSRTTLAQDRLWKRLRQEPPPLLGLGRNPYMLLMTAQVYAAAGGELPANRAQLFAAFVDTLLKREQDRGEGMWAEADIRSVKDGMAALAYAMQAEGERGTTVERAWALNQLCQTVPDCDVERLLYLATSATLLDSSDVAVRFYHQLLQEYFAAREMGRRVAAGERLSYYWPAGGWWEPSGWEETAILLAGMKSDASALLADLADVNPIVAARCLLEGGAQASEVAHRKIIRSLMASLSSQQASATGRVQAGDALARLGDPRFRADAWYLPDEPLLGFVKVPAGSFLMGTREEDIPTLLEQFGGEREWYERETLQHPVDLPAYYIARYPVTVAQFRAFVRASSYEAQGPWESWSGPDNHPVVGVAWYDAVAYCDWLTERLRAWEGTPQPLAGLLRVGAVARLPTEAEWEKAARGTDGRIFPWGDEPDPNRANYDDTGIGATSTVGCFPGGASPYVVLDMSGNVWEWCATKWQDSYREYRDDNEPEGDEPRVLRGGAFYENARHVRCARRYRYSPNYRFRDFGFRVLLAPGL